jgi:HPt (histidine-containing phosphotransfer) domain-containing protein
MEIEIPPEARAKYLERREKDLEGCQTAIANLDFPFIERVGHQIKGNASTFGYAPLASIGEQMEAQALEKNTTSLKQSIEAFAAYLKQIKNV